MAPCLQVLLSMTPLPKSRLRKKKPLTELIQARSKKLKVKLAITCPWKLLLFNFVFVCVCEERCVCGFWTKKWLGSCALTKSLPKAQLPSLWRMVPFHLTYLSRKWTHNPLFFSPVVYFTDTPLHFYFPHSSPLFLSPSALLSDNFCQLWCLILLFFLNVINPKKLDNKTKLKI